MFMWVGAVWVNIISCSFLCVVYMAHFVVVFLQASCSGTLAGELHGLWILVGLISSGFKVGRKTRPAYGKSCGCTCPTQKILFVCIYWTIKLSLDTKSKWLETWIDTRRDRRVASTRIIDTRVTVALMLVHFLFPPAPISPSYTTPQISHLQVNSIKILPAQIVSCRDDRWSMIIQWSDIRPSVISKKWVRTSHKRFREAGAHISLFEGILLVLA